MNTTNQLQKTDPTPNTMLVFGSQQNFDHALRMANALSASSIVPVAYQGEKGHPNCIIALEMANRIGMSPLMVMQNLYVVHGNVGWSSKFLIAALNSSGKFSPIRYEFKGTEGQDDWSCRAWAVDSSNEKLYGSWVSIAMAKKEGWYDKNGSKWKTMPELMLQYRAGAFFQRVYAPEISMGMQTSEELHDTDQPIDIPCVDVTETVAAEIKAEANGEILSATPTPNTTPTPSPQETAFNQESPAATQKSPATAPQPSQAHQTPQPIGQQPMPSIFGNQQ